MNKMNKKGKIIGLSLAAIMLVSLFAVAIPSVAAQDKPDLVITGIQVVGNRIQYTIENIGDADAPTSYTGLYIDGIYRARDRVGPLNPGAPVAPGSTSEEVFAWYNYRGGDIKVCADYQDRIDELNEENNCGLPDLVIIGKVETVDPVDCTFTVTYTVHNDGSCNAGASETTIWIDGVDVMHDPVPALEPCDTYTNEVGPFEFECIPCTTVTIGVEADNNDDVAECNEDNNILENDFHCPAPDLEIIDKFETVDPVDCTFTVTYTVHNDGSCNAGASETTIWIDGVDVMHDPVPALEPCDTYRNEVGPFEFECIPCTTVTIGVEADNEDVVEECDEENNLLENDFHCPAPDLEIIDKFETVDPVDCTFTVTYTVHNDGICDAGASETTIWIDGVDVMHDPVPALEPCDTYRNEVGPFDCPPCDTVTIGVEADNEDVVEECDEENNLLENEFHCPAPDLEIIDKFETVDPVDCTFTVTYTVHNDGICDAGASETTIWIDGVDVMHDPVPALEPCDTYTNEVGPFEFECIPCTTVTIGVEADNEDVVEECDEENNLLENEFHCPAPDLEIIEKFETVDPVDCTFTVTYTVHNDGICDAGASETTIWIDGVDVMHDPVPALEPCDTYRNEVGPFDCPPCDTVTIGVEADNEDVVEECDEENNLLENEFHCPAPDLEIIDKFETVDPVDCTFTVTYTVHNDGICDAGESETTIWIDGVDVMHDPVPALEPCDTYTNEVGPFDCPPCEDKVVKVCADNNDEVEECDEENNCMTNILICPCALPLPDLSITNCEPDGNRIHYTIENIGGAPAPTSYTCLYIDGIYRARDRVDPLDPGAPVAPGSTSEEVFAWYNYRGGDIEVRADCQDRIEEADENNNNCFWPDD